MGYSKNEEKHREITQKPKFSALRGYTMKYSNIIRTMLSCTAGGAKNNHYFDYFQEYLRFELWVGGGPPPPGNISKIRMFLKNFVYL